MTGELCACGCGARLPAGKRPDARYLDGTHRAAASDARRGVTRRNTPASTAKPPRRRRSPVVRDTVTVTMPPEVARAAASLLRATGAPRATAAADAIAAGLKRRGDRIERATDGATRG